MREILKNEFRKITHLGIDIRYDASANELYLYKKEEFPFKEGQIYYILLKEEVFNDNETNLVYNNGKSPRNLMYRFEIDKIYGQYIKFSGWACNIETGEDLNEFWSGYIRESNIEKYELIE